MLNPALIKERQPATRLSPQEFWIRSSNLNKFLALPRLVTLWRQRAIERQQLAELSDDLLRDVGLSREEATQEAARPFWSPFPENVRPLAHGSELLPRAK